MKITLFTSNQSRHNYLINSLMTIEKNKGMKKINNSALEIARKPHNEF